MVDILSASNQKTCLFDGQLIVSYLCYYILYLGSKDICVIGPIVWGFFPKGSFPAHKVGLNELS